MGGIETLIVRAANSFAKKGHEVIIFARSGVLESALDENIQVINFDRYNEIIQRHYKLAKNAVLVSFDPLSYMVMQRIQLKIHLLTRGTSRGHAGIFHPRTLFWDGDPAIVKFTVKLVFFLSSPKSFFFMSESVKLSSEIGLGVKTSLSNPIIKLPIASDVQQQWAPRAKMPMKIVSVGRIVPFKSYNRQIPKIMAELRLLGIKAHWDVWGDGTDLDEVSSEIQKYDVADSVKLRGNLDYKDLSNVILDSDLFVGMGTAALEASILGVPTICCIDQERENCYGFLFDAPSDSIGERSDKGNIKSILQTIMSYVNTPIDERILIGKKCRIAALSKSGGSDYNQLLEAPTWPGSVFRDTLSIFLSSPYLFAVDSRRSRSIFKFLRRVLS